MAIDYLGEEYHIDHEEIEEQLYDFLDRIVERDNIFFPNISVPVCIHLYNLRYRISFTLVD
jgi:hypothetical protein